MAEQENKDFSEDVAEQNFEQNGEAENGGANANAAGGGGDATENGQENQEDRSSMDNQDLLNDRKLFVGGLSWETTDKELRDHFSTFGDIESINVKTDPTTGRSRGFAFIVFAKAESLDKAMAHGDHIINGKKVDPKKAKARHGKIFVGGLSTELSDEDIKSFFGNFGTIIEMEMPFDKTKNQRKNFCFITFESEAVANELLKNSKQSINGKDVEVKKATPRPDMGGMRGMGRGGRGARGSRGRGFGGQGGWGQGGYGAGYGSGYGGGYGGGYDGYGGNYDYYGGGYGGYGGYDYAGYGHSSFNNRNSSNHHSTAKTRHHYQDSNAQPRMHQQSMNKVNHRAS
ncbi:RNA-binding protein squid isoform X2 [Trichogramma pretiosum]|uniref:RNA-binding protein squid isoform X2 n=1 Tax=Trichogramma pretiosum TaxID=7493 RepID=UPI0006C95499|nr:RNA-binding protein squid isoform X2 [Trichogramma pretiosum]